MPARRSAARVSPAAQETSLRRRRRRAVVLPEVHAERTQIMAHDDDPELIPAINGPHVEPFRRGEYLHVSDLIYKCVRQIALADKVSAPMPDQVIYPSQGITFALGRAVEDFVLTRLKDKSPSSLYGTFTCICGNISVTDTYRNVMTRRRNTCAECSQPPHRYQETTLVHEPLKLVGNVDFTLMDHDHLILCELKSMADNQWQDLERPRPEHLVQILLYWWMAREAGMLLYDKVCILYVNKQYQFAKSPYKEFVVQPSIEMRRIEDYLEDARALQEYFSTGVMPPRLQCPHEQYTKAKQCHVSQECFTL